MQVKNVRVDYWIKKNVVNYRNIDFEWSIQCLIKDNKLARDNFNKPVIQKLKDSVNLRCSNPDCRVPTSAPSNNIGKAAHITAAASGGPRYDPSMTIKERKSYENGIWLCSNCADKIDNDESKYPVDLLKKWKSDAEETALKEQGKKQPSNTEVIDTMTSALSGLPSNFVPNAISNVHKASEKSLENLDPRFQIESCYINGNSLFIINPKQDVSLTLTINKDNAENFIQLHKELIEHGTDLEIKNDDFSVEGSKLIDRLFTAESGSLKLSRNKIPAINKLWLIDPETKQVENFNDIQGHVAIGTKSFSFKGQAYDDMLKLSYCKDFIDDAPNTNISLLLDRNKWTGKDVTHLPYFDNLSSLFNKMNNGWELYSTLEIEGIKALSSSGSTASEWAGIIDNLIVFNYTARCQKIARHFGFEVKYEAYYSFTAEEHQVIAEVVNMIETDGEYTYPNQTDPLTCNFSFDSKHNIVDMISDDKPVKFRLVQEQGDFITMFGIEYQLPPRIITAYNVQPTMDEDINDLQEGDVIKVTLIPIEDYLLTMKFKDES